MKTKAAPATGPLAAEIRLRSKRLGHDDKTTAHLLSRGEAALATLAALEQRRGIAIPSAATTVTVPAPRAVPGVHVGVDRATGEPFAHFCAFLGAVRAAEASGQRVIDPRLRVAQFAAASGMSEAVPSDGGFAVPTKFSDTILTRAFQEGQLLGRTHHVPIDSPYAGAKLTAWDETSRVNGQRLGGAQVFWVDEASTAVQSKPKLRQIETVLRKLIGLVYLTNELVSDAPTFGDQLAAGFALELVRVAENDIVNGPGTSGLLGLLRSPALIVVPKESGQVTGTFVAANAAKMASRLFANADPSNVAWLINQELMPQVMQIGWPLYAPAIGGDDDAPYGRLLGRPIVYCEAAQAASSQGDVILVDASQYLFNDRSANYVTSMHVKFLTDESAFRVTYRVAGQPIWSKAVTPLNGSNTVSSHVTLQAR